MGKRNERLKFPAELPPELHHWLKATAATSFTNMNDLLVAALESARARRFTGCGGGAEPVNPDAVPDEVVNAATLGTIRAAHGGDGLRIVAAAVATEVREQLAACVEAVAANYPEDVFPPNSDSRDAISGTAMRHAYRNAARVIREEWPPG